MSRKKKVQEPLADFVVRTVRLKPKIDAALRRNAEEEGCSVQDMIAHYINVCTTIQRKKMEEESKIEW